MADIDADTVWDIGMNQRLFSLAAAVSDQESVALSSSPGGSGQRITWTV